MSETKKITVDKLVLTETFVEFLKSARDFCNFIETYSSDKSLTFIRIAQLLLQEIYLGGQDLEEVILVYNREFSDLVSEESSKKRMKFIADRLEKSRYYWHVFDPTTESEREPVCGDLVDDLGDIYKELKNSLLLFDTGKPEETESAVWTFKWGFDNHWGNHCINAIYALHYFIKTAT
jgi:hypothetical protein